MVTESPGTRASAGFTLIEVMVVMAVFVIGILATAGVQVRAVTSNAAARRSLHATALAARCMERMIAAAYEAPILADRTGDGVAGLDNDRVETADGFDAGHPPYTLCWNVAPVPERPADGEMRYKRVRVIVTWKDRGTPRRLPLETIRSDR